MDLSEIMNLKARIEAEAAAVKAHLDSFKERVATGGRWEVAVEDGLAFPGETLRGNVRFVPESGAPVRGLRVRLAGCEHTTYERVTHSGSQHNPRTSRAMHLEDLPDVPVEVPVAEPIAPGRPIEAEFELPVPPATLPSTETSLYSIRWVIEVTAGSADAVYRAPIVVAEVLGVGGHAAVSPDALAAEVAAEGDAKATIALSPAPLVAGQPYSGCARIPGANAGRTRVVIEARVDTRAPEAGKGWQVRTEVAGVQLGAAPAFDHDLHETLELWRGEVKAAADGSITWEGIAPAVPCVDGPRGSVRLFLALVENRRLMPDKVWRRPIAVTYRPQPRQK